MAKLVLPVPGGPKRMTAFGGITPYRSASAGSGQRQHDPPLDGLLLPFHSREAVPQSRRQHPSPEFRKQPGVARAEVLDLLVEDRARRGTGNRSAPGQRFRSPPGRAAHRSGGPPATAGAARVSAIRALPIPRLRHVPASATSVIQARSPWACATAMPTSSSPTTATTAGPPVLAAATTSETGNTAGASSACRFWSQIWMAWSRSSSWKSRNRHVGIVTTFVRRSPPLPWGMAVLPVPDPCFILRAIVTQAHVERSADDALARLPAARAGGEGRARVSESRWIGDDPKHVVTFGDGRHLSSSQKKKRPCSSAPGQPLCLAASTAVPGQGVLAGLRAPLYEARDRCRRCRVPR